MQKILIVDDTPIVLEGTALAVESLGFEVEKAANGTAAIELFKASVYAAIIMDCNMPLMDGFDCTKQIRLLESKTESHVPIIGYSSSSDNDIREKCLAAGMDAFISKDCSQNTLSKTVCEWAGTPELSAAPINKMAQAALELVLTIGQIDAISDHFEGVHEPDCKIIFQRSSSTNKTVYFSVGSYFYKCQPVTLTAWRVSEL